MPIRPGWRDEYWKQLDKETAKKIRTTCARDVAAPRHITTSSTMPDAAEDVNIPL